MHYIIITSLIIIMYMNIQLLLCREEHGFNILGVNLVPWEL